MFILYVYRLVIKYLWRLTKDNYSGSLFPCNSFFFLYVKLCKMKKPVILFVLVTIISCGFPGGGISIKHSQHDHYYEMTAKYNPDKTGEVDRYLNKELSIGDISFMNTNLNADITLDDKTTFYIQKSPGYLHIKFDKEKNSEKAYTKLKTVLEGIGEVVR